MQRLARLLGRPLAPLRSLAQPHRALPRHLADFGPSLHTTAALCWVRAPSAAGALSRRHLGTLAVQCTEIPEPALVEEATPPAEITDASETENAAAETATTDGREHKDPKRLLSKLGRFTRLNQFQQALELMFSLEKLWNPSEHLMRAIKNCGNILKATPQQRVTLLRRIEDGAMKAGIRFNRMHYNCCIKMACANDDLDTMVFMVRRMKQRGIEPDAITYTSIIHAYARRGDVASSERIFELMQASGVRPNIVTYTALLGAYYAHNDVRKAWEIYQALLKAGLEPEGLTYRCLIRLFVRDQRTRPLALALYTEMRAAGILPDRVTFMATLRALVVDGDAENAANVFADCQAALDRAKTVREARDRFAPNGGWPVLGTEAYNQMIEVYVRSGQFPSALGAFEEMRGKGVKCDPRTYNLLLEGCLKTQDLKTARRLLAHMQQQLVKPNPRTDSLRARLLYIEELREFVEEQCAQEGGFEPAVADPALAASQQGAAARCLPLLSVLLHAHVVHQSLDEAQDVANT